MFCWRIKWIAVVGFLTLATASFVPARCVVAQVADVMAVDGAPFGVFSFEVPLPPGQAVGDWQILVHDQANRVFYPAVNVVTVAVAEQGRRDGRLIGGGALVDRIRNAIRGNEKQQVPVAVRVSGLYRGNGPLNIKLSGDLIQSVAIRPIDDPKAHAVLLAEWWSEYLIAARRTIEAEDHPGLIQKYLTSMLARRFGFNYVDLDPPAADKKPLAQPLDTLALLAAIEPLRDEVLEDVLRSPASETEAKFPVPESPRWLEPSLPLIAEGVEIEPIARRVPPECLYLRFGSFSNYVWFQELSTRFGGDISQAVFMRGFNYEASARMERMLGAKLTAIAKMFGDKLIDDMALIGTDLYLKEGGSLGAIFSTNNAALLMTTMQGDRQTALKANPGATLGTVQIAGHAVSLLSTPDNRLRSFMASDGNFVFVTTSSTLMRRFLEVGAGEPSLADTPSFQWARTWMPAANNYSVFAYFSPDFFHNLVSPQYQIELRRRMESIAHLEIAEVASAAAKAEMVADDDLGAMQAAGLLPEWFDERADGARTLYSNGSWIDSTRGARGSFLPIADAELNQVTEVELDGYSKIAAFYQDQWRQMDPLLIGLRRFQNADNPNAERVAVEGYIAPFGKEKYGWIANMLGPASDVQINLPADDAVSLQLHMSGANPIGRPTADYHLFAGVKDMVPPAPEDTKGLIAIARALKAVPGYIGTWPMPGLLDQLPLGLGGGPPDIAGYSRLIGGLWRWQGSGFSLVSFDRSIIDNTIPQLEAVGAPDIAQARLNVSNLQGTKLSAWINGQWYERGWAASRGDVRLLHSIEQQLKVPGRDALNTAQQLLDVRLQCPLGGEFQYSGDAAAAGPGLGTWSSTAWAEAVRLPNGKVGPPQQYSAPWLEWFRGGKIHLTQLPERLAVVGTIDLELPPRVQSVVAGEKDVAPPMGFDLFQLPFQIFGDGKAKDNKPDRKQF